MWEQVRRNQRRSALVVAFMGVLLAATGAGLGFLLAGRFEGALIGGGIAVAIWLILWIVAVSEGDRILLGISKARRIEKKDHPQLFNVVEEMTIAASLPDVPRVYIIDDPSPNAFATGRKPEQATVAVTTGLLRILDRDELQGVIAHELGHIKNRDVMLMTTAGIMVGAVALLAQIGLRALWYGGGRRSRSDNGGGGAQLIAMIVALLLLILAPIAVQLLYFSLSRRREFLADASGARFTRYPEGLASALEKIGGSRVPTSNPNKVTAPMYISRPLREGEKRSLSSAFSTHPPLETRIRILRSMGSAAGYRAYDQAYAQATGRHAIGSRTLAAAEDVAARGVADSPLGTPAARRRAASDAFLAGSGYRFRSCGACGAKLKIPAELAGRVDRCTRCGTPLPDTPA